MLDDIFFIVFFLLNACAIIYLLCVWLSVCVRVYAGMLVLPPPAPPPRPLALALAIFAYYWFSPFSCASLNGWSPFEITTLVHLRSARHYSSQNWFSAFFKQISCLDNYLHTREIPFVRIVNCFFLFRSINWNDSVCVCVCVWCMCFGVGEMRPVGHMLSAVRCWRCAIWISYWFSCLCVRRAGTGLVSSAM